MANEPRRQSLFSLVCRSSLEGRFKGPGVPDLVAWKRIPDCVSSSARLMEAECFPKTFISPL